MPCGFDVTFDPLFNSGDVVLGVLEVFSNVLDLRASDHRGLGCAAGLGLDGPAAMLDTSGEVVWATIDFSIFEVKVLSCGGAVIGVEARIVNTSMRLSTLIAKIVR